MITFARHRIQVGLAFFARTLIVSKPLVSREQQALFLLATLMNTNQIPRIALHPS
jgi:hypothetical protein